MNNMKQIDEHVLQTDLCSNGDHTTPDRCIEFELRVTKCLVFLELIFQS